MIAHATKTDRRKFSIRRKWWITVGVSGPPTEHELTENWKDIIYFEVSINLKAPMVEINIGRLMVCLGRFYICEGNYRDMPWWMRDHNWAMSLKEMYDKKQLDD